MDIEDKYRTLYTRSYSHDEKIDNLEKMCDDNFRDIVRINELNDKLRHSQQACQEKIDKIDKTVLKIGNELEKVNNVEKNIEKLKEKITQFEKDHEDFEYKVNKKFLEAETNVITLVSTVSDLSKRHASEQSQLMNQMASQANNFNSNNNKQQQNVSNNAHMSQIPNSESSSINAENVAKINKEIDSLKKLNREFSEKIEKMTSGNLSHENMLIDLKSKLTEMDSNMNKSIKDITDKFEKMDQLKDEEEKNSENKLKPEQNIEILYDQVNKIQDAIRSTTLMLHSKITKDELEKVTRILNFEIEKCSAKILDQTKINDNRSTKLIEGMQELNNRMGKVLSETQNEKGNSNVNLEKLNDNINSSMNNILEKNLKEKISELIKDEEFSLPLDKENLRKIDENKTNINNILNHLDSLKLNKDKENDLGKLESKMGILNRKVYDLDDFVQKNKTLYDEKFKNIEGDGNFMDDLELQNEINPDFNVFEIIKYICINSLNDAKRIDIIKNHQENMNSDILQKVKKDLSLESHKVLEDFRNDLKISIMKIEGKLGEKVDLLSLDEFGRRVDCKLNNEINKKLDRVDLKKNNNIINKKIDILENKISKTLVDTLIDLQMDDAPLLVKKSNGGKNDREKCASCNQFINLNNHDKCMENDETSAFNNYNSNNHSFIHNSLSQSHNNHSHHNSISVPHSNINRYKFRSIQDNSNKYGTGSYSRHLSNIDSEDLKQKNFQLPDISGRGSLKNSMGKTFSKIKIDEFTEKRFNSMIHEELEKNIVNPDNLIKTANKFYDNAEKRHNNNILKDVNK